MNENEIKKILLTGECVTLDCRRAKSEVSKSVGKHTLHLPILSEARFCWELRRTGKKQI